MTPAIANPLPCSPEHGRRLAAWGLDFLGLAVDARTHQRARALAWVSGLRTKPRDCGPGIDRGLRVAMCGRLVLARELDGAGATKTWGLANAWCRDRACPTCAAMLMRERAKKLKLFVEPRIARTLFVTLTQPKLAIELEGAADAADRVLGRDRKGNDTGHGYRALWRGAGGRLLALFIDGGLRTLEVVLSKAGTVCRDGAIVAVTGWHSHLHSLCEVSTPSTRACRKAATAIAWKLLYLEGDERPAACDEARRLTSILASLIKLDARIARGDEVANEWCSIAQRLILARWLAVCPGAEPQSQKIERAHVDQCTQVTKYVTKPFEIRDARRARELFVALDSRKAMRAWGTWASWAKSVELVDDADAEQIEVSRTPVRDLFAVLDGNQREIWGRQVVIDFRTHQISTNADRVMQEIRTLGGTFAQRSRAHAFDDEAAALRDAVRRESGRLRLNALGLFDGDRVRDTWASPPYALRDHLERRADDLERAYRERATDIEPAAPRERTGDPIARLEHEIATLRRHLGAPVLFGDRDELEHTLRQRVAELDECRGIRRANERTPEGVDPRAFADEAFAAMMRWPDRPDALNRREHAAG